MTPTMLPIALRVHAVWRPLPERKTTTARTTNRARLPAAPWTWPPIFVFDCETTTDPAQRLLFGAFARYRWTEALTLDCVQEGLIYADELGLRDPAGFACLREYAETHQAQVVPRVRRTLVRFSRAQFVDAMLRAALESDALIVGFNLPFDIARVARGVGEARRRPFYGGFSFLLAQWMQSTREGKPHPFRPWALCKTIDSKRALMGLAGTKDVTPRQYYTGWPFLDLRTLTFALTGEPKSLEGAGRLFRARVIKKEEEAHGVITPRYIDYCRRDVQATAALLEGLRREFDRHPIPLVPSGAFSPASIGKGYLSAMGVCQPAKQFAAVKPEILGVAMLGYFGGRAEARIRRTPVPVAYCDFLSMYPTVNSLMGMWDLLTAAELEIVDATDEVRALLDGVTVERIFDPVVWNKLRFFALVEPTDDLLPVRAQYALTEQHFGIGVNCFTAQEGFWYAGPDVVASTVLTGRAPRIQRAFRLVPKGRQDELRPVQLRGEITVDPTREDFFRRVVEARTVVKQDVTRPTAERDALEKFLKVLANSSGYGIFAELNPQDLPPNDRPEVTVYGPEPPFRAKPTAPEKLGEYCFPPFAALTTAGARLMLALVERVVTGAGGTYAFCDTDSMAIVASPTGGLIPCEGGPLAMPDGTPAIHALPFPDVDAIVDRFASLNPYNRDVAPGSILKQEHVHLGADGSRGVVQALAISAKRYALFHREEDGAITLLKVSEHGLGHLRDPRDREDQDLRGPDHVPGWIADLWHWLICRELGVPTAEPAWFRRPALGRVTISTPRVREAFARLNANRTYTDAIKPMNFVLSAQVARFGHPEGADPAAFQLLAPYERDADRWETLSWINKYTGEPVEVSADRNAPPHVARIKTIGEVAHEYLEHAESKSADGGDVPCGPTTRGLLQRRHVRPGVITYIGKEANRIEEVEAGLVHHIDEVRTTYGVRDTWSRDVVPALKTVTAERLAKAARCSVRTVKNWRNGHTEPSPKVRRRLERALAQLEAERESGQGKARRSRRRKR
jgi:hypothetical protein